MHAKLPNGPPQDAKLHKSPSQDDLRTGPAGPRPAGERGTAEQSRAERFGARARHAALGRAPSAQPPSASPRGSGSSWRAMSRASSSPEAKLGPAAGWSGPAPDEAAEEAARPEAGARWPGAIAAAGVQPSLLLETKLIPQRPTALVRAPRARHAARRGPRRRVCRDLCWGGPIALRRASRTGHQVGEVSARDAGRPRAGAAGARPALGARRRRCGRGGGFSGWRLASLHAARRERE
jgi:hypothetical protein